MCLSKNLCHARRKINIMLSTASLIIGHKIKHIDEYRG